MIDPAVIESLRYPMPPEPPRVVEERLWLSEHGQRAQRAANAAADQYDAAADLWLGRMSSTMAAYAGVLPGRADRDTMTVLDEAIADVENAAQYRARWRNKFAKKVKRATKMLFQTDPSLGAVSRDLANTLLRTDDRVIAGLLEYALFLRAVRAEGEPRSSRHPETFTNGANLRRALDRVLKAA